VQVPSLHNAARTIQLLALVAVERVETEAGITHRALVRMAQQQFVTDVDPRLTCSLTSIQPSKSKCMAVVEQIGSDWCNWYKLCIIFNYSCGSSRC
jgi:hypothetical protein